MGSSSRGSSATLKSISFNTNKRTLTKSKRLEAVSWWKHLWRWAIKCTKVPEIQQKKQNFPFFCATSVCCAFLFLQLPLDIFSCARIMSYLWPDIENSVFGMTVIQLNNQTICIVGSRDSPTDNYTRVNIMCYYSSHFISILWSVHCQMG